MSPVLLAFLVGSLGGPLGGLAAGLAGTTFLRRGGSSLRAGMLAFAGGFILAVSFLELLLRAIERAPGFEILVVLIGLAAGAGLRGLISTIVGGRGHHPDGEVAYRGVQARKIALSLAVVNVVEGLTVGVGFAVGTSLGLLLGAVMIFENFTEGVSVSTELVQGKSGNRTIFLLTTAPTATLGIGAAAGAFLGGISELVLAGLLGAGAGIMLYVVGGDILYDAHQLKRGATTTVSLIVGVIVGTAVTAIH